MGWVRFAYSAIMHVSPAWAAMLGGHSPAGAVDTVEVPLANYYRAKGIAIVFTVDATDGLNRAAEAPELVAAGRSITASRREAGPRSRLVVSSPADEARYITRQELAVWDGVFGRPYQASP